MSLYISQMCLQLANNLILQMSQLDKFPTPVKPQINEEISSRQESPKVQTGCPILPQPTQTLANDQKMEEEQQLQDPPSRDPLKCDPSQICNLSQEERQALRREYPELSGYLFLSQRDKSKYLHVINQTYREKIKLADPPGSAPKKKTIKFKNRFEIKDFRPEERSSSIGTRKSYKQLYRAIKKSKKGIKARMSRVN